MSDERPDPMGKPFDGVATEQLLDELARPQMDGDEYWERVRCLHMRGGREVFDFALEALNGLDGLRRRTGADVLLQLGYRDDRPFADETIPHLLDRLRDSTDPDALVGILGAFGHLGFGYGEAFDENRRIALPVLRRLCVHEDEDVREALAAALNSAVNGPEGLSIEAALLLCDLSRDRARDVRDWATFWLEELPTMFDLDLPEVRKALWERVGDEDEEIRVQAIEGLANHRDRAVIPFLAREIQREAEAVEATDGFVWLNIFDAAKTLADPALLPALRLMEVALRCRERRIWCEEAIAACGDD